MHILGNPNLKCTGNYFLLLYFLFLLVLGPTVAVMTAADTDLPSTSVLNSPSKGHFNTLPACK